MDARKDILWRIYLLYLLVVLMGIAITWKIAKIQFVEGDKWREKALALSTRNVPVKATRGNILASDGSYLAISVPAYELRMDTKAGKITKEVWSQNIDSLAICLANIFPQKSKAEFKQQLSDARRKENQYLLVASNVTRRQVKLIRKFPIFRMGKYDGGLIEIEKNKRVKPFGNLAARTIGKESGESQGLGIEQAYDEFLKGEEGLRMMEKLAGGMLRPIDQQNTVEPKDGLDIITTIDPRIQDVAESELEYQLRLHDAGHGCVVLMEVATGDIKAIANLKKDDDGNYYESYNYAIGEATDAGSTFKLATMIALLEDGHVKLDDQITTDGGKITIYNHTISDTKDHGTMTVKHAFEVSSNVAMIKMAMKHYGPDAQKFVDHLKRMHMHEAMNTGLPGEATPFIRNKGDKGWSGLSLPSMSIGYEVLVTPMQILALYNAIANDGKMMKPRFVTEVRSHGETVKTFAPTVIDERICSEKTAKECQKMLEGVVENGTAQNLKNSIFKIAGKTGTAQISNNNLGYRSANRMTYRASFCGYFPADEPKYTCIVIVNAPSNNVYYGNVVAGPIFKSVADKVYASAFDINQEYYRHEVRNYVGRIPVCKNGSTSDLVAVLNKFNITHSASGIIDSWSKTTAAPNAVQLSTASINLKMMPDVRGMGAKDAVFILEKMGIRVQLRGRGTVKQQSVQPGTNIALITNVALELS